MSQLPLNTDIQDERQTTFAEVILPLPLPRPYTYRIPGNMVENASPGCRVVVQFGKKRILTGIIHSLHHNPPLHHEAKPVIDVLDEEPVINAFQFNLFQWVAEYYMCTIGEVFNAAIPSGLKLSSQSRIQLNPAFSSESSIPFSEKELMVIEALEQKNTLTYDEVSAVLERKTIHPVIKSLLVKERIIIFEEIKEKYIPKKIRKIRLHHLYAQSKPELERLFQKLDKRPHQTDILLKYLQHVPVYTKAGLNEQGIEKNILAGLAESSSALNTLIKNKVFEEFDQIVSRFEEEEPGNAEIKLSSEQEQAKDEILELFKEKEAVLLHGITGSGKTEIFINLIQKALDGGSQVLYMLPEIALTTQIVNRLKKIFGGRMGVYHSKFSDNERVEVWKGIISGKFSFIIGVRSSVLLPFDNLGLVIIDEEHESSYKQYDPAPRYHAKDTALMLARLHNAKTLLGSATPALESYYQAEQGKWGLVKLNLRFGGAVLPEITLIDLKKERKMRKMKNEFSHQLLEAIQSRLQHKEQAIIFQNRRGYAPHLACEECAFIPKCENCSVSLTYHLYSQELRCHYCGYTEGLPSSCKACGSPKIKPVGLGTEKIEEDLNLLLPEAAVQRMDLDSTRKKNSYSKILYDFEKGNTDILVGTQMVTKGLDFDRVSLVGIMDADRIIHFPDFRSFERAFQMLTQVSGRAGRREKKGNVLIQTWNPAQPILSKIIAYDYEGFYKEELSERKKYKYPPFYRLIKLTVKDADKNKTRQAAETLVKSLSARLGKERVLGPEAPLIEKIRNYYQKDILVKLEREKMNLGKAKIIIKDQVDALLLTREFKTCIIAVDVDPA